MGSDMKLEVLLDEAQRKHVAECGRLTESETLDFSKARASLEDKYVRDWERVKGNLPRNVLSLMAAEVRLRKLEADQHVERMERDAECKQGSRAVGSLSPVLHWRPTILACVISLCLY